MQHSPSEIELNTLNTWCADERLQYFLSRAVETEEVWSLGSQAGWELQQRNGKNQIPLWPYLELARLNISHEDLTTSPQATSLDNFFQTMLPVMIDQEISLEILGMPGTDGKLINAIELYSILESMLDSGDYYLEG